MKRRTAVRIVRWTVVFGIGAFAAASALLISSGLRDELHRADVAVVLGNTVNPDGTPSDRLAARLDTAVEMYRRGLFPEVIVSGGVGREGFDEAAVMKQYLVARGLPEQQIHIDSYGVTTAATAKNVAAMMRGRNWSSVLVVSQYFHIPRCRLALQQQGVAQVYSAHARYFELRDIYSTAREVIGYVAYLAGARE